MELGEIPKTWIVVIVIVLLAAGALWLFKPSTEEAEEPINIDEYDEEDFLELPEEGEDLDEIDAYAVENFPSGKITTVELRDRQIAFGGPKAPHHLFYYEMALLENARTFVIDEIEFTIGLESDNVGEGDEFYILLENLTDDFEEFIEEPFVTLARKRIELNTVSSEPIAFPIFDPDTLEPLIEVEYYYYIREAVDEDGIEEPVLEIYFFLAEQNFELQFGKKMRFKGTFKGESVSSYHSYYFPDLEFFGNNPRDTQHLTAQVQLDEDGDGGYEITAFVDTATGELLDTQKPGVGYSNAVEFDGTGMNEEGENTTEYGTIIEIENNILYARMPVIE